MVTCASCDHFNELFSLPLLYRFPGLCATVQEHWCGKFKGCVFQFRLPHVLCQVNLVMNSATVTVVSQPLQGTQVRDKEREGKMLAMLIDSSL